jgi:hypothetical protein
VAQQLRFAAACVVIECGLKDPVAPIFFAACDALRAALKVYESSLAVEAVKLYRFYTYLYKFKSRNY